MSGLIYIIIGLCFIVIVYYFYSFINEKIQSFIEPQNITLEKIDIEDIETNPIETKPIAIISFFKRFILYQFESFLI